MDTNQKETDFQKYNLCKEINDSPNLSRPEK